MVKITPQPARVALLDLYKGVPNQGMNAIRGILTAQGLTWDEFDVRANFELPDTSYDLYISSGGPGEPWDFEGGWDKPYFKLIQDLWDMNKSGNHPPKYVFFICHSYQLACMHFRLGTVCKRSSTAFGIMSVHITEEGEQEPLLDGIPEPFHAVDSRDYQVIQPDMARFAELDAQILLMEKIRHHVHHERAVMGIRFSNEMMGTQFHPEADPEGMKHHFALPHMKEKIVRDHGMHKYINLMAQLNHPENVLIHAKPILERFIAEATSKTDNVRSAYEVNMAFQEAMCAQR